VICRARSRQLPQRNPRSVLGRGSIPLGAHYGHRNHHRRFQQMMRRLARVAGVLLVVCCSTFVAVYEASAAEVASATGSGDITDKIRCAMTYSYSTPSAFWTSRGMCYMDASRSTFTAGTDFEAGFNVSPTYVYVPVQNPNCLHTMVRVEMGPQTAANSMNGVAIPAGAFQFKAWGGTGASCGTLAPAWNSRVKYTGSSVTDQAQCTRALNCVTYAPTTGWPPSYPPDHYPGNGGGLPSAPALTCSTWSVTQLANGITRTTVDVSWSDTPHYSLVWTAATLNGATVTATVSSPTRVYLTVATSSWPSTGDAILTLLAGFTTGVYTADSVSCTHTVDEDYYAGDSGYNCPSGWSLLNPSNLLDLARCMFIPRDTFMDEQFELGTVDEQFTVDELGGADDDDSLFAPAKESVRVTALILDIMRVEDAEMGNCVVSFQLEDFGGNNVDRGKVQDSGVEGALEDVLAGAELCPDDDTKWIVHRIRDASAIFAGLGFMRFIVRRYRGAGASSSVVGA